MLRRLAKKITIKPRRRVGFSFSCSYVVFLFLVISLKIIFCSFLDIDMPPVKLYPQFCSTIPLISLDLPQCVVGLVSQTKEKGTLK